MHTDEYEIPIGREISLCSRLIRRLKSSIQKREKRYGISTEGFLKGMNQERLAETNQDFLKWAGTIMTFGAGKGCAGSMKRSSKS